MAAVFTYASREPGLLYCRRGRWTAMLLRAVHTINGGLFVILSPQRPPAKLACLPFWSCYLYSHSFSAEACAGASLFLGPGGPSCLHVNPDQRRPAPARLETLDFE